MMNTHDHYALKTVVQRCINLERETEALKAAAAKLEELETTVLVRERADHQKTIDVARKEREKLRVYLNEAMVLLAATISMIPKSKASRDSLIEDYQAHIKRMNADHPGAPRADL